MRCTEMQLWPANENAFAASFAADAPASASAATITGVELPSSSLTRLRGARSCSFQPTSPEPVKVIMRTRGSSTSTSPIPDAGPTTTVSQPSGSPASRSSSARRSADSGVALAGFRTTGQPAASAGAILCATRLHGKLKGEIAPTTPSGRRSVNASLPSPACAASMGIISPASLRASTAANVYVDIAREASTRAVLIGLPASSQIVRATSSWRLPMRPATFTRISARLCAGSGLSSACSAASIARRVSSAPLLGARPTTSPEYGEWTSTQSVAVAAMSVGRKARGKGVENLRLNGRHCAEEGSERLCAEHEQRRRAARGDRGGARLAGDERDLAEEVSGAELVDGLPAARHVGDTVDDDDELLSAPALVRELAPRRK